MGDGGTPKKHLNSDHLSALKAIGYFGLPWGTPILGNLHLAMAMNS